MKSEIINLLKKENKLSEETINELQDVNIHEFSNLVKDLGKQETEYIKADEILKDLNTDYIGKNLYIYNEVDSTNTVAKFLSMNDVENGSVVISEKQRAAKGRSGKIWESPIGGVWLSIILTPTIDYSKHVEQLLLLSGLNMLVIIGYLSVLAFLFIVVLFQSFIKHFVIHFLDWLITVIYIQMGTLAVHVLR